VADDGAQYNESTLLLVLKHMIYSLTHPTPPLEGLIRDHFRRRAPAIIRRCQRILEKTSSLAAPAACAGVTCSSSPGTCSSSPAAAGAGSGEGRGASASAAGAGDTHASQERMEEGDGGDAAGDAVGWADRSLVFFSCFYPLLSSPASIPLHPFLSLSVGLITVSDSGLE
jgi:hypothetical protein